MIILINNILEEQQTPAAGGDGKDKQTFDHQSKENFNLKANRRMVRAGGQGTESGVGTIGVKRPISS